MAKVKSKAKSKAKSNKENVRAKNPRCGYNKEHLMLAVQEALGGRSVAAVPRKYNVPESTTRAKKLGKYADKPPGPVTTLSVQDEKELVEWIFHCGQRGFPVTKRQLIDSVKLLCDNDKRKTPSVDNKPGRSWFEGFLKRHPNVSQRISENVSLNRAKVSEYRIRSWFAEVTDYLTDLNLSSIHLSRVFNADETGVPMNPKPPAVLAPKGCKNVYNIVNNNEKENITVLVTANAAGNLAPPLVLFAGQSVPKDVTTVGPANYSFGFSDNGWMTARNFFEYIANVFHPWLIQSGIEFPVILYIDGHSSHITLPLSQFCQENNTVLIALCPNATHILQPLDVSFFRAFKLAWQKCFNSFCQNFGTIGIKKRQFALVLQRTFEALNLEEILKNGFKTCGLHPWNVNAIDYAKVFESLETTSSETTNGTDNTAQVTDKLDALKVLENLIGKDKLNLFIRKGSPTWTGQKEDESLFDLWHKLATPIDTTSIDEQIETRIASDESDVFVDPTMEFIAESRLTNTENFLADEVDNIETDFPVADDGHDVNDTERVVLELIFNSDGSLLTQEMGDVPDETVVNSSLSTEIVHEELKIQDTAIQVSDQTTSEPHDSKTPPLEDPELSKFSEPLRKILFWTKDEFKKKNKRRTIAKKMPSVLSSTQWQSIKETEENEKRLKAEQTAFKKKIKIEKQELTKKEKEEERERKEAEKLKKEQIKFEKEREKLIKQQEKMKEIEAKQKAKEESLLKKKETVEIKKKIDELRQSLNCDNNG